jgi:hypothetical protein
MAKKKITRMKADIVIIGGGGSGPAHPVIEDFYFLG